MNERDHLAEFARFAHCGAEQATRTLSSWLRRPMPVGIIAVESVCRADIRAHGGAGAGATVMVMSRLHGGLSGTAALQLSKTDAWALVCCLRGTLPETGPTATFGGVERSMLEETANILFSSLMNALACLIGHEAVPGAPVLLVKHGAAALDALLLEATAGSDGADQAMVVTARLDAIGSGPLVRLVLLPAPGLPGTVAHGATHARD